MGESMAYNFMQVADKFGSKVPIIGNLAPTALYALASPSTPEPVREAAIAKAEAGENEWPGEDADLYSERTRFRPTLGASGGENLSEGILGAFS